jgi:ubiquinone/menaquinone biosynthesis C-methylase UbiE
LSFYQNKILPHIINCACSSNAIMKIREKVVPLAYGTVLEVGMGSAVNLGLYDPARVDMIWGLEPSIGMREKAASNLKKSPITVEWLSVPGEQIPLDDNSVDSVVLTYTLCTIPDWRAAMKQIHRVLKPDGKIIFCEHGQAPDHSVQKWQNRLNSLWGNLFGGCHLNRPVIENIRSSGFTIDWFDVKYIKGMPKIASYTSFGIAAKSTS